MALILLLLPGLIAALLLRAPWLAALALAPGLSTTAVVLISVISAVAGVPWGLVPLIAGVSAMWLVAAALGYFLRRHTAQEVPSRLPIAALVVTGIAAVAVALVLLPVSSTPEAFPQHPDTIFHLGVAQWMVENQDASFLHADGFLRMTGSDVYPAAFHTMVATVAQVSGVPVVVSASSLVLVTAGVAWPLGCVFLARTLFGPDLAVTLSAGVVSMAFSVYPYLLMGYGVLWPNFFGQSLLPGALALLAVVLSVAHRQPALLTSRLLAMVLLLAALPGLAVAHPNALVTLLLFGYLMAAGIIVGKAWEMRRDRPWPATASVAGLVMATGLAFVASTVDNRISSSMQNTAGIGPELSPGEAISDMLLFAPRGAPGLWVLAALVAVGAGIVLMRHRGRRWLVAALIVASALFYLSAAVDTPTSRLFTWAWYSHSPRLAVVVVLPAALLATVALAAGARLLTTRVALPHWASAVAAPLLFAVATGGVYVDAHRRVLDPFFNPMPDHSWASNEELLALHALARDIPSDAVVAENPWNGGSYMYVVSGRQMLFPTEKDRPTGDRMLLASRLDEVGSSPEVCAAARRERVQFAITGGSPVTSVARTGDTDYVGIDAVGTSDAFRQVAKEGPYTLYRMVRCAGGDDLSNASHDPAPDADPAGHEPPSPGQVHRRQHQREHQPLP